MGRRFRKINRLLHLWLGLISGIVVCIICITGCLYVFKDEINDLTQPWKFVEPQNAPQMLPSEVLEISNGKVQGIKPFAITYGENYDAVFVDYFQYGEGMNTVYLNPYNGEVIKTIQKKADDFDFFSFVLKGHRTLWLPHDIGKPIIGYGVLLFLIALITGIIIWWPKKWNRANLRRNFRIKWRVSFSRINFSLHNVLGGLSFPFLVILCFTGLIWSFTWFSNSVYYATSGGKELIPYTLPQSDTLQIANRLSNPLDQLYQQLRREEPNATTFYFALPQRDEGVIRVSVVHKRGSYYQTDNLFYDQYTLQPLQGSGPYAGRYKEASGADKFRRMNLEIHDGRILGLFGKILAFLASLVGASLPVTGVIIWFRKKRR